MVNPSWRIGPSVSISVPGRARPSSIAWATGKTLNTEPSSYTPWRARLNSGLSPWSPVASGAGRRLGSKSGRLARAAISPVRASISTAEAPLAFIRRRPPPSTSSTAACTVRSIDSPSGSVARAGSRRRASWCRSIPAVPITSAAETPSRPNEAPPRTCEARLPLGYRRISRGPNRRPGSPRSNTAWCCSGLSVRLIHTKRRPSVKRRASAVASRSGRIPASALAAPSGSTISRGCA